jgi:hypothetical protein
MINQVNIFTPIEEEGKPWMSWLPLYLSPLLGTREIAVLETPVQMLDGSRACHQKELKTTYFKTTLKVITYIFTLGIFPYLAMIFTIGLRINNKFHYTQGPQPVPLLHPIRLAPASVTPEVRIPIAPHSQGSRGTPLRPNVLPNFREGRVENCPAAPIWGSRIIQVNNDTPELIQWIKNEIGNDANWGLFSDEDRNREIRVPVRHLNEYRLSQKFHNQWACLTQNHWIEILNEIPAEQHATSIIRLQFSSRPPRGFQLDRDDIQNAFAADREIILKQRLAVLVRAWIQEVTPQIRQLELSPEHPFHEMYLTLERENLRERAAPHVQTAFHPGAQQIILEGRASARKTLIGLQDLIRFLPLLKVLSAQKRDVVTEHPDLEERRFSVNYLLDSVLDISKLLTRLIIHNMLGPSGFVQKGAGRSARLVPVRFRELDSDKIVNAADILWNAYVKAKDNNDISAFLHAFYGVCFDARISGLNEYIQKFATHPDFVLNIKKLNTDVGQRVSEYYEKFTNEQCVLFCERQDPKLEYEAFRQKMLGERRGTDQAKVDPQAIEFFRNYASEERFKAWAAQIHRENMTRLGIALLPSITNPSFNGDPEWENAIRVLKEDIYQDFEP